METILQSYLALCERIYELILEENQILKATAKAPDDRFLDRKRDLLFHLEESLEKLRAANAIPRPRTQSQRILIDKTQQVVMKTLLLDRENEQVLLKCTLSGTRPMATAKPTLSHLQRIYGKHQFVRDAAD
jgi:hypothetical protein